MSTKLGALSVFLTANTSPFQRKMKEATTRLGSFKMTAIKIGGALAGAFALSKVTSGVDSLVTSMDDVAKSSQRIGIATEAYQKLTFAARRAGATSGDVEKAFKRMTSTIFDAGKGLKEANDALSAIGITYSQLNGLAPEKQFRMIADRLGRVEDASTKAALAQDIFGRAGTALIPMLKNYKEIGRELEKIGGVMSKENVKAAEDFKDAMEDLGMSMRGTVVRSGMVKFLGDVAGGMDEVIKKGQSLKGGIGELAREFFNFYSGGLLFGGRDALGMQVSSAEKASARLAQVRNKLASEDAANAAAKLKRQQEQAEVDKIRADIAKRWRDEDAKALKEENDAYERNENAIRAAAQAADRREESFRDRLDGLRDELDIREKIANGLEREAFIMRILQQFDKDITDQQRKEIEAIAEDLFELQQQNKQSDIRSGPALSEAIRAGSRAETALVNRTAFGAAEKMRKRNVDANVATAREVRLQNQQGIKLRGVNEVKSVV